MIEKDKIYLINIDNLTDVKSFSIKEETPYIIAVYLLGRRTSHSLLCRPGYRCIFLRSYLDGDIMKKIKQWLDSEK